MEARRRRRSLEVRGDVKGTGKERESVFSRAEYCMGVGDREASETG